MNREDRLQADIHDIKTTLARMDERLKAFSSMKVEIDELEKRVVQVEQAKHRIMGVAAGIGFLAWLPQIAQLIVQ